MAAASRAGAARAAGAFAGGLVLCVGVAMAGRALSMVVPYVGGVTLAILVGVLVGNLVPGVTRVEYGVRFVEKRVLEVAIVLLGLDLQLRAVASLGVESALLIVGLVAVTVPAGVVVGGLLGLRRSFGVLLGVGAAICGASAIAAVAPLVPHEEEEVGLSVGAINLVGVGGLLVLPAVVLALGLGESASALLIGGSLPAVGHVVAAGFSLGDAVGRLATVVKMGRILLLGPLVLLVAALGAAEGRRRAFYLPWFVIGFVLASVLVSMGGIGGEALALGREVGRWCLAAAMAAIGLRIRLRSLAVDGPRALLGAALLVLFQVILLLAVLAM